MVHFNDCPRPEHRHTSQLALAHNRRMARLADETRVGIWYMMHDAPRGMTASHTSQRPWYGPMTAHAQSTDTRPSSHLLTANVWHQKANDTRAGTCSQQTYDSRWFMTHAPRVTSVVHPTTRAATSGQSSTVMRSARRFVTMRPFCALDFARRIRVQSGSIRSVCRSRDSLHTAGISVVARLRGNFGRR